MARPPKPRPRPSVIHPAPAAPDATVLDLLDHLLNKGVMVNGDIALGVAGVDLIHLRLSALLCAADLILGGRHE